MNQVSVGDSGKSRNYYKANQSEIWERREYSIILVSDKAKADAVALSRDVEKLVELLRRRLSRAAAGRSRRGTSPGTRLRFPLSLGEVFSALFRLPRGWAVKVGQFGAPADAQLCLPEQKMQETAEKLLKEKLAKWRKDFTIKINMLNLKDGALEDAAERSRASAEGAGAAISGQQQQQQQQLRIKRGDFDMIGAREAKILLLRALCRRVREGERAGKVPEERAGEIVRRR